MRVRGEVNALEPQDRFEQSVLTEKLKIETDFPSGWWNILIYWSVPVRTCEKNELMRQEELKNAAEISTAFPSDMK